MYCDNCKINFQSDTGCCPLCHEKIGDVVLENRLYPPRNKMITKNQLQNFSKLYFFISFICIVVTALINYLTQNKFSWSVVVFVSLVYIYILIKNTILAKSNIGFKILLQAILMSGLLYAIDYFTTNNSKWSLDFAIPFMLVGTTLSLTLIAFSNYKKWRDYFLYIFAMVIIGMVPFIFYLTEIIDILWPSLVSGLYSFFTIVGMIIFYRKKFTNELKKSFHI